MFELVFSVCLIANAATCKDVHLAYEGQGISILQCALFGQHEMAKWVAVHPQYRIAKFRCGTPRSAATEI